MSVRKAEEIKVAGTLEAKTVATRGQNRVSSLR
jgi:hypothetical protein